MRIEIAQRLRPFCHLAGAYVVLPGSSLRLQIYPTLLRIDDLSGSVPTSLAEVSFAISGPLQDFTILQDLEKGSLRIWGKNPQGFFRYAIKSLSGGEGIQLSFEKTPTAGVKLNCNGKWKLHSNEVAMAGDSCHVGAEQLTTCYAVPMIDRLSLGSHKAQDWEQMRRRRDFADIFPIWHRLGQIITVSQEGLDPKQVQGTAVLLSECRKAIEASAPETILSKFENLFLAGFEGALSPRLSDSDHQGFAIPPIDSHATISPLMLLSEGAKLIRSLFVQNEAESIKLLPAVPPEFSCGRLINVDCRGMGELNLEWTKKMVRILTFQAKQTQCCSFHFFQGEKSCRLRLSNHDRGYKYSAGSVINIVAGQNYWFDNFEK